MQNGKALADSAKAAELGIVLSGAGYECVYGGKWHAPELAMADGHGFLSICGFSDWDLPPRCVEFIRGRHERPFFLVAGFDNPHNICEWSRGQPLPWGPVPDAAVEDCPALPDNFQTAALDAEAVLRARQASALYRAAAFDPDDWRRYRHAYYRLIEQVDRAVARILEALRDADLDRNTLIIFSSDHGDGTGAHQWNQKSALYEECVRVPLIIAPPGVAGAGRSDGVHLVSNGLDLYPTICDYAGAEVPPGRTGLSLRPLLEGDAAPSWRESLVCETVFGGGAGTSGLMARTEHMKYCLYSWGKRREQLFDLEVDPGEMSNLAEEPVWASELQRHRNILAKWIEETDYRVGVHYAHPDARPLVPGQEYPRK